MDKKILIVDDDTHIRILLEQTLEELESEGVELIFAGDGKEALETILENRPELVFLDIMMPHMNGFDVCREVKKNHKLNDVHIIFLTAKGQEFDLKMADEVGGNDYMTKPFSPDELLKKAKDVLSIK